MLNLYNPNTPSNNHRFRTSFHAKLSTLRLLALPSTLCLSPGALPITL